ncbi:MAG: hypothetical protein ACRDP6_28990 [Actinoallomurus sp.]
MSIRRSFMRSGALVLSGVAAFAVSAAIPATAAPVASIASASTVTPAISAAQVIANAETWHPHTDQRIPYSQSAYHNGYRTDCSGYASMALGLSAPGPNTVELADGSISDPISMGDLQTGDLVIDSTGDSNNRHVVIFQEWTDASHSSYWAYEQRGGYGTDHRVLTYGLDSGSEFHPYRPHVLGGGGGGGKYYVDTFAAAVGYASPDTSDAQGVLNQGTNYVYCRVWGAQVGDSSSYNHWWMRTDLDSVYSGKNGAGAYVSAYYLSRWGNDVAKDNNGNDLPDC